METSKWENTYKTIDLVLYFWWMSSITGICIGLVTFLIFIATGKVMISLNPWVIGTIIAGLIVPGMWFRSRDQED